jgi:hypothetical protein
MVKSMAAYVRELVTLRPAYRAVEEWKALTKRTVARFARGNIPTQRESVLMPDEQDREKDRTKVISDRWRKRAKRVA